jgi:hypothetical protein
MSLHTSQVCDLRDGPLHTIVEVTNVVAAIPSLVARCTPHHVAGLITNVILHTL